MNKVKHSINTCVMDLSFTKKDIVLAGTTLAAIEAIKLIPGVKSTLATELYKVKINGREEAIDGWSISHFFLHAYYGYNHPDEFLKFFAMGVAFELLEDIISGGTDKIFINPQT